MKVFLLLTLVAFVYGKAPYKDDHGKDTIPNEYLVQLKHNTSIIESNIHLSVVEKDPMIKVHKVFRIGMFTAYHMTAERASMERLLENPSVSHIEPNKVVRAYQEPCRTQTEATWGIVRTIMKERQLNGIFDYEPQAGEGVDVYIIDTGIYTQHKEFADRAIWGTDTVNKPSEEIDDNGHGTHVAGTVMSNNFGLARSATAIAVKVLNGAGSGSFDQVIEGIQWVTQQHETKKRRSVANMSLGGGVSTAVNAAVDASSKEGVIHVVAAGNEAQDACKVSPASAESAITVACSNDQDGMCSFSNYGSCVDIIAPGDVITSAWIGGPDSIRTLSGTSMSAPHVAGIIAKILSASENGLTPDQARKAVTDIATPNKITGLPTGNPTPNKLAFADCPLTPPNVRD